VGAAITITITRILFGSFITRRAKRENPIERMNSKKWIKKNEN